MMGSSQNFFLTLRKPHKSLAKFMNLLLVSSKFKVQSSKFEVQSLP
jgi:hypothetical protein